MKTLTLLATILALTSLALSETSRPNILLIFADDVGSDAIGAYGGQSYPTPHIDALAEGGAKFTHGYAMPVCHPSRIALMTGKYPARFGKAGMKWGDYPDAAEGHSIGGPNAICRLRHCRRREMAALHDARRTEAARANRFR